MARSPCTFTIKTPHSDIKLKDRVKFNDIFQDEIEKRAINVSIENSGRKIKEAFDKNLQVAAIFFQRVCARTPLDEDYFVGFSEDGQEIWHKADKIQCRMDWYVTFKGKTLKASQVTDEFPDAFDDYDDKEAIENIADLMKDKFGDIVTEDCNFIFGNDNPHFATLEYGGYKKDGEIKIGPTGIEHGIENKHSVQAPVGMLRITQMELESMYKLAKPSSRYKKFSGRSNRRLSDAELKKLLKKFKASKRLPLSDIKRYIAK